MDDPLLSKSSSIDNEPENGSEVEAGNIQNVQSIQSIQNVQNVQSIQNVQNVQSIQNLQNIEPFEGVDPEVVDTIDVNDIGDVQAQDDSTSLSASSTLPIVQIDDETDDNSSQNEIPPSYPYA